METGIKQEVVRYKCVHKNGNLCSAPDNPNPSQRKFSGPDSLPVCMVRFSTTLNEGDVTKSCTGASPVEAYRIESIA